MTICSQKFPFLFQRRGTENLQPFDAVVRSATSEGAFYHLVFFVHQDRSSWRIIVVLGHTARFLQTAVNIHVIVGTFFGGMKAFNACTNDLDTWFYLIQFG